MDSRPKIAVVHPGLVVGGGSEACAMLIVEALKDDYDLTIITSTRVDLDEFNDFYGTHIRAGDVTLVRIPPVFFMKSHRRFAAVRTWRLARYCKKNSRRFELAISTYGAMDFDSVGVQYILDPTFNTQTLKLLQPEPPALRKWFYRESPVRRAYLRLGEKLSGFTLEGIKKNLTLVDSDWTGRLAREAYGLETRTVYPPVTDESPDVPWEAKENGFVCMGRIIPEKQVERTVDILHKVRDGGLNIHLHIVGRAIDRRYVERLKDFCRERGGWACVENDLSGQSKMEFLARHKYGIHGKQNEPFGITIAEMVKAGCLVWVPKGGGQVEIVNHPDLIYSDPDDAVSKIVPIIQDPEKQALLRKHLTQQAGRFSTERFKITIQDIVRQALSEKGRTDAGSSTA
jgi:glycosyltransferase involved in cell wall biosynthesis